MLKTTPDSFSRQARGLVLPFVLHALLSNSFILLDTVMVASLGQSAVAAMAAAGQFSFILGMLMAATWGSATFITQFHGRGDTAGVHRALGVMLLLAVSLSTVMAVLVFLFKEQIVLFFITDPATVSAAVQYLSIIVIAYVINAVKDSYANALGAIGKIKVVLLLGVVGLVTNTGLNLLLIFGLAGFPRLELQGAAIATVISSALTCLVLIGFIYIRRYWVNASVRQMFSFRKAFVGRMLRVCFPLLLHEGVWASGSLIYAMAFGHLGVAALAAYQLVRTLNNYFLIGVSGFSYAARVLVGKNLSNEDPAQAIDYAKRFTRIAVVVGLIATAVLLLANPVVVSLFPELEESASRYLRHMLYIHAAMVLIFFLNHIWITGIMRAGGDNLFSFRLVAVTTWGIGVPLVLLGTFVFNWPVEVIFLLFTTEELTKAIWGFFRIRSGRWANNLTKDMT